MTSHARMAGCRNRRAALALALLLPSLAACQAGREVTGSIYPADHRDRHPIVLADAPRVLDVFVEGAGGLVSREKRDISAFLAEHHRYGNSNLVAQVPTGIRAAASTRAALDSIRQAVGGRLTVVPYSPADPAVASPIRLSFQRLQAKVAGRCGLWPEDLGVSDYAWSERNRPYWNLGCATQANLAAQVADPVDLVRGRTEGRADTGRRLQNIDKLRQGQDPSTTYRAAASTSSLSTIGSQ